MKAAAIWLFWCLGCIALLVQTGCNVLALPAMAAADLQTEKVPAEFAKFENKKAAVLVWTEPGTLFQFPHIRLELASQIAYQMDLHCKTTTLVPPQNIADYQSRNPNWDAIPPSQIGKQFGADYVIFIELLEYSTREPRTPGLFHGRARASVVVHDVADPTARWTLAPVEAEFSLSRSNIVGADDQTIHRQMLEILANKIVAKFYNHEVPKDKVNRERQEREGKIGQKQ